MTEAGQSAAPAAAPTLPKSGALPRVEAAWKRHEQSGRPLPPVEACPQATIGSDPTKSGEPQARLRAALHESARLLPRQGPIGVFVHHNTLHAFEHLDFELAVLDAAERFGAQAYMSEAAYRAELARGRIRLEDVDAVLDRESDPIIFAHLGRSSLRRAMITPGVREFDATTVIWRMEQGDLARDFRRPALRALFDACFARTAPHEIEPAVRRPVDEVIHPWLIRLCAVYMDQGAARWPMPCREQGFYISTRSLLGRRGGIFPKHLAGLDAEFQRQQRQSFAAPDAVLDALEALSISEPQWLEYIEAELLALPGWAGLMHRLEEDPTLAPHVTLPCSLMDFLAVRLTLARVASCRGGAKTDPEERPQKTLDGRRRSRTARVYDAARVLRLSANEVRVLPEPEWAAFAAEVKAFHGLERRRILHLAYERAHEREILRGLSSHRKYRGLFELPGRPMAQVFFCLDEREESLRRALEEVEPRAETLGAAGYFGVAVDYKGLDDAVSAAFCPVVVTPAHAVSEQPRSEDREMLERRRWRRRLLGRAMQRSLVSSRTLVQGWISTAALGLLSALPLAGQLLAPRRYAHLRDWLNRAFLPEPRTELTLMRNSGPSSATVEGLLTGFTPEEKTERVAGVLRQAGLVAGFARLVLVLGHGSTSLNNPHESAHDCGACGGRRGGPNARLFAAMANRPGVRDRLRAQGIEVPADTWFLGGYHDTCSDEIDLFDLDSLPAAHRPDLEALRAVLDRARSQNARERCRRFDARGANRSPRHALRHVEGRSEHLAQPRPEYGHCTNAVCIVGRRRLTRGLFLDRRAFLASYDAHRDPDGRHLAPLLDAVVPVCAGINLEYYFSFVDNDRYGCGTKLPHNVTGLVGVMDGHASDLRTGLPWQMVEIHEPVRILFVVETPLARLAKVLADAPAWSRLVRNRWIRLAAMDPDSGRIHVWRDGGFEEFRDGLERLPVALSSHEWYADKAQHLPMAWIPTFSSAAEATER